MSSPGPGRPTNAAGRHTLPGKRPDPRDQQPRAAFTAVPVPRSTAMERQISTPYIDKAAPPPYRSEAEADEDRREAIAMVNSGRQSNNADAVNEQPPHRPEGCPLLCDSKGEIWSPRELEAAELLLELRASHKETDAWPTLKGSKELKGSIRVNADTPPLGSKIEPKPKPIGDTIETQEKKAKIEDPEKGEPQKEKPEKGQPQECDFCGKGFARPDHVKRHVENLHSRKRKMFECDICGHLHSRKDNLRAHRRNHKVDGPEPEPRVWYELLDRNGKIIRRWPADQTVPVVADGEAQVGEGRADTIDSPAQPDHEEGRGSGPSSSPTTAETGTRFKAINRVTVPP